MALVNQFLTTPPPVGEWVDDFLSCYAELLPRVTSWSLQLSREKLWSSFSSRDGLVPSVPSPIALAFFLGASLSYYGVFCEMVRYLMPAVLACGDDASAFDLSGNLHKAHSL